VHRSGELVRYFVGITGASGHAYATRLIQALVQAGHEVDLSVTAAGRKVLFHELGIELPAGRAPERGRLEAWLGPGVAGSVRAFPPEAIEAPASSGTALTGGVVLCPCSMGTLARVSVGLSSNLVERAADVALKEGRRLVLVTRETPLSVIHLENQLRLARLGAVVLPASPGFYHHPSCIDDLLDHVVGKVLDRLGIRNERGARWSGQLEPPGEPGIEPPARVGGEA
jgi:4-hydroxy-3-polyprenylbenzoate decarboxylase